MKRKLIFFLTVLAAAGGAAWAGTEKPVTVAIFEFSSNAGNIIHRDLTALVTADLSTNANISLVERGTQLKSVLGEEAMGLSGNISPDSAASIGVLTGAKVLVTGRVLTSKSPPMVRVIATVVGTETGREFAETAEGPRTNLIAVAADISGKIARVIAEQATNFTVDAATLHERRLDQIIEQIKGKQRPAVQVKIAEQLPSGNGSFRTAETELQLLFQKAGFAVVDEKSDQRPNIIITGDAVASANRSTGNLSSCRAALDIRAQERTTGKILAVDSQEDVAVDISEPSAARKAVQNATDDLAERLLPLLAQSHQ